MSAIPLLLCVGNRLSHYCASLAKEERKKTEDLARLATCRYGTLAILFSNANSLVNDETHENDCYGSY